ncbi:hypothetical protein BABINDRAFT_163838 [Babjeviella inositovora NRRL Y-12698]|uniref:Ribosomal protein L1 n=1 Tax=Babjeviella inositovora NRRL Y-12698 TaxID=984486 RepID=A0A1E3QHD5_9ASCO|nr:uncharacterized protein BABINDRAFT_163838 [Babjeviella inositovora NRRL Y-12698]ODQ77106.1 hypothetical protein BABINDRAFT_163838 [Babjeviella inositovora NRRL Y-12698]
MARTRSAIPGTPVKGSKPNTPKGKKAAPSAEVTPSKTESANSTPVKKVTPAKKNGSAKSTPVRKTSTKPKGKVVKGEIEASEEVPGAQKKKQVATPVIAAAPVDIKSEVLETAISELIKFVKTQNTAKDSSNQLFSTEDEDAGIFVKITTKKFFSDKPNFKPKSIRVPHSVHDLDNLSVCLFVRDDLIDSSLLEKIESSDIKNLSKIITGKQLKGEYKQYEAKRKLASEYDLFLVDDALMNSVPKTLGSIFYSSNKKAPLPIKVSSLNKLSDDKKSFSLVTFANQIAAKINSTSFLPPMGVNIVVKIGQRTLLDEAALKENLYAVLAYFFQNHSDNLRTIEIKSESSPAIPIYYAKTLYSEEDVLAEKTVSEDEELSAIDGVPQGVKLTEFEKGLLELGDEAQISKLGKKFKKGTKLNNKRQRVEEEKAETLTPTKKAKKSTK